MTVGVFLATLFPTVLACLAFCGFFRKADPETKRLLLWAFLLELPMCAVALYVVRKPNIIHLGSFTWSKPGLAALWPYLAHFLYTDLTVVEMWYKLPYGLMKILEAPFTEELAKLWPLLIPLFRRGIHQENAVKIALALGIGFGVGEMWLLAFISLAKNPEATGLPFYKFYQLGGFISERFMVCILHGTFTFFAVRRVGNRFFLGVLQAMGLHYLCNFPIFMVSYLAEYFHSAQQQVLQFLMGKNTLSQFLHGFKKERYIQQLFFSLWVAIYFLINLIVLIRHTKKTSGESLLGDVTCPGCGQVYARPLFGMNFLTKRYERCSQCKKWHWVRVTL